MLRNAQHGENILHPCPGKNGAGMHCKYRGILMDERFYVVKRIDGDYAYLERTDERKDELLIVARALLPEAIDEGTKLKWAFLMYEIIE